MPAVNSKMQMSITNKMYCVKNSQGFSRGMVQMTLTPITGLSGHRMMATKYISVRTFYLYRFVDMQTDILANACLYHVSLVPSISAPQIF